MVNDGLFLLLALMTLLVMFLYAVITLSPEDAIRTEPPVLNPPAPPPPSPGSRWPHTPRSQLPRPGLWGSRTRPPVLTWVSTALSYSLMRPPRTGLRLIRCWERSATGWSGRGGCSWLRWGRRPL
jgi:hypothetical protein